MILGQLILVSEIRIVFVCIHIQCGHNVETKSPWTRVCMKFFSLFWSIEHVRNIWPPILETPCMPH